jgi:hypothetical protein
MAKKEMKKWAREYGQVATKLFGRRDKLGMPYSILLYIDYGIFVGNSSKKGTKVWVAM